MAEWERVRLNEVIALNIDAVPAMATTSYDIVGVLNRGRGLLFRDPISGDETSYKTLNRIRPNQIVYSRLKAFEGAITVTPNDLGEVYASQEFPTFTCGKRMLPEYIRLLTTTKRLWEQLQALSTGMGGRRERVKPANFLTIEIALPSLSEQRRVIDVMAAVDAQIATLDAEAATVRHLLRCALSDHFESILGRQLPIEDLCSHVVGGIWGSPEGENEVDVLALGPRIYAPTTTGFVTDGSPIRSFTQKQVERRLVQSDDIILERSGGSPEQPVGRVVIAQSGLPPCIPTDFQRLLRPSVEKVEPRYLFWRLQHDWNAGLTRSFSRRTTGITNLSVKDYIARAVPVPDRNEQRAIIFVADAIALSLNEITNELARLRTIRSALLESLLNQEIEIPESYDAAFEGVS
ncbi:restriction endonuclease subunit S [Streptomyces sp. H27-C3]|uniref:restriction endonuclease subunit S n=1 Tax=Streptomyces sp. H27-C3 TaxID=3046305 RepID=UPI0024B8BF8C|nr:restriction endonuclease subunit S [Streptomyces sp. H27-C3]MDJ0461908.1 restriction endonuclease subunit S [Streptomyces sp. H27-C3]